MSIAFTPSGVSVQTLEEITAELIAGYQAIYGPDINFAPDSPDGQSIGIKAKLVADMQNAFLLLYNQQDPDFAFGQALISKIKYAGITARPATRSYADVSVVVDRYLTLDASFTVVDELGQEWILDATGGFAPGTNVTTFFSKDFGAIEADPNTINQVVTIVPGVVSVNNSGAAVPGVNEETDEELRLRRSKSVQLPSFTPLGGIFARLANTAGVTEVKVYENPTENYDADLELDPHHVWAIVEGGSIADIAESLAYSKTAGAGTKGDTAGTYVETLTGPSGAFTITHTMNFDRPDVKPLYVRLTISRKASQPVPDVALIKSTLSERAFGIGEEAFATDLYQTVYSVGKTYAVYDLEISNNGVSWTEENLFPGYDGRYDIDELNITVTEVVSS